MSLLIITDTANKEVTVAMQVKYAMDLHPNERLIFVTEQRGSNTAKGVEIYSNSDMCSTINVVAFTEPKTALEWDAVLRAKTLVNLVPVDKGRNYVLVKVLTKDGSEVYTKSRFLDVLNSGHFDELSITDIEVYEASTNDTDAVTINELTETSDDFDYDTLYYKRVEDAYGLILVSIATHTYSDRYTNVHDMYNSLAVDAGISCTVNDFLNTLVYLPNEILSRIKDTDFNIIYEVIQHELRTKPKFKLAADSIDALIRIIEQVVFEATREEHRALVDTLEDFIDVLDNVEDTDIVEFTFKL